MTVTTNLNDLLNTQLVYTPLSTVPSLTVPKTEAAVDTKAQRAKVSKSDYAWPDADGGPKFPITTQAQVMSASRLLGRAKTDDATRARIKSAIIRIAKRKGFSLPKAWASSSTSTTKAKPKESAEATATLSDQMVSDSLRAALRLDTDPDGDGDDERGEDTWVYCWPIDVYEDRFVYSVEEGDGDDTGIYMRSYSIDANDQAVLGDDIKRVIRRITYDPFVDPLHVTAPERYTAKGLQFVDPLHVTAPSEGTESDDILRAFIESLPVGPIGPTALTRYEREAGETHGTIMGTAIAPGFNRSRQRFYPKETLAAAVSGFIGKKMYKDHSSVWDDRNRPERSVDDIGAVIESAWVNTDGGIGYKAVVADPDLDAKLALMAERGILSAIGVSVNYTGLATRETIGDESVERIDSMDLNSLDFVTEPGAWGTVARLESHTSGDAAEETVDMADDTVVKGLQEKIDSLVTSMTTLTERTAQAEARAIKAEVRTQVRDLLADSVLPPVAREKIAEEWDGKETVEGLAERVAKEIVFIESITGKKLASKTEADAESVVDAERRKLAQQRGGVRRVVVGNGDGGSTEATAAPLPKISEVGGWLLGKNAKTFEEQFVIKD